MRRWTMSLLFSPFLLPAPRKRFPVTGPSAKRGEPLEPMAEAAFVYLRQAFAVGTAWVQKLCRDPFKLFTLALQPVLWLVLFGEVMERTHAMIAGGLDYMDFLAAGILSQSVLFVTTFYGVAAIWERDLGILHRYLVSPSPRSALVLGNAA
jgi:ABC-2 type transport system permease protein